MITNEKKVMVFKEILDKFETDTMRLYCEDMIKQIPDYIFTMPSSTSGKFHNKTQCQQHGQIYHILMFAEILNYRLALKCNKEKFNSDIQRDAMRCVPIFHDAIKCGMNGSSFTVHDHPILAGEWVRNAKIEHDIDSGTKESIARMCERHSGEWTSTKRSKIVLPEPESDMEIMIHECDILSSRNNIDMQPPEYLKEIFSDMVPQATFDPEYKIAFGKHSGRKLIDVYKAAPDYITWCEENIHRSDFLQMIKAMKEYLKNKENT